MLLLSTDALPTGNGWAYQLKLDGYRAIAFKSGGTVHLRSRNDKSFNDRYAAVVTGLARLPDETIIDGEIVALDQEGRPSFDALQNHGGGAGLVVFYVFDLIMLSGRDLTREPFTTRRRLLEQKVLPRLAEPVRYAVTLDAPLPVLVESVKQQGLEGLVAKRLDSPYEPGLRSGAWQKMRVNRRQEFVIGGYTRGASPFDAVVLGVYDAGRLVYVARTRNGFTPASRTTLFKKLAPLVVSECPFANLPEPRAGRWSQGLTAAKMQDCVWLEPTLVAEIEFLEWTGEHHLRHAKFVRLREDKKSGTGPG